MKQNWLDKITKEDVEKFLRQRFAVVFDDKVIDNLESSIIDLSNKSNGKIDVEFSLHVHPDYDPDECYMELDEFREVDDYISLLFEQERWADIVREKNLGRTINGKTYDEARFEYMEDFINNYFAEHQEDDRHNKADYLQKLEQLKLNYESDKEGGMSND